jgi:hypothetical protein
MPRTGRCLKSPQIGDIQKDMVQNGTLLFLGKSTSALLDFRRILQKKEKNVDIMFMMLGM